MGHYLRLEFDNIISDYRNRHHVLGDLNSISKHRLENN